MWRKRFVLLIILCFLIAPLQAALLSGDAGFDGYAHFNFTAWNTTPMDDWNWSVNSAYAGNGTDSFLNTWLQWGLLHNITLMISNATTNYTISQFYNLHNVTPTVTATPTPWQPIINPSTDIKTDWVGLLWEWWWLPFLILVMILLFRGK